MRILLVEDDPLLGDGLRAGLRQQGFAVDWVRDGWAAERGLPAAILLAWCSTWVCRGRTGDGIARRACASQCHPHSGADRARRRE